ncbi:MAG: cell envelope integrity protein TolA [Rhizobiaceae bacterium]|nr:cell envelope integrity protein TolA [Rhizobiaceae bacterium]
MRGSVATSVAMHAVLLGLGLISLSSPRSMDASVESVSVDIVPVEEVAQVQMGDKKAPMSEKPAPTPTTRPDTVPDAQKVGDNEMDTDKPLVPDAKPKPVESAQAPKPQPKPEEPVKKEEVQKVEEPKPVPATEVAQAEQPKQEVAPDPAKVPEQKPEPVKEAEQKPAELSEQKVAEAQPQTTDSIAETVAESKPVEEQVKLPDSVPAPAAKPRPPEAQTAKAPDRKASEQPAKEASSKPKAEDSEFNEDEVAALLSKEKTAGGGAKRSSQTASLGGRQNQGAKLSRGEEDALREQLSGCWTIPAGAEGGDGLRVKVAFNVDSSGKLEGRPRVEESSGNRAFDQSAIRAVQICDQQGLQLPAGKADVWAEIAVNFDPSAMF